MLSGRVMVAELASKLLLLTGLHSKTRVLGIRNELSVTIMCDALLSACHKNPLDMVAARTGNAEILALIQTEFDAALEKFVNTHTRFAPEQLKQWYAAQLEEQQASLASRVSLFAIRASEDTSRMLSDRTTTTAATSTSPTNSALEKTRQLLFPSAQTEKFSRTLRTLSRGKPASDNVHSMGMPNVVICPKPTCGIAGRRHIARRRGLYYDSIYHAYRHQDGRLETNYHDIRIVDAETAQLLMQEYAQEEKKKGARAERGPEFKEKMRQKALQFWAKKRAAKEEQQEQDNQEGNEKSQVQKSREEIEQANASRFPSVVEYVKSFEKEEEEEKQAQVVPDPFNQLAEYQQQAKREQSPQQQEESQQKKQILLPPLASEYDDEIISPEKKVYDNFHQKGSPNVVVCPRKGCEELGRRCTYRAHSQWYEAVYHRHNDKENRENEGFVYHIIRRISDEEAAKLAWALGEKKRI